MVREGWRIKECFEASRLRSWGPVSLPAHPSEWAPIELQDHDACSAFNKQVSPHPLVNAVDLSKADPRHQRRMHIGSTLSTWRNPNAAPCTTVSGFSAPPSAVGDGACSSTTCSHQVSQPK